MTATGHEPATLTGAYALDALDGADRARFEAHLAGCEDCAAEVASLRAAAAELTHTAATTPPAALREHVLASIGRVRPLPPPRRHRAAPPSDRWSRWLWPAVAAACAVLAIAGGVWGYQQHHAAEQASGRAAAITAVLDAPDAATATTTIAPAGKVTVVYSKARGRVLLIGRHLPTPADHKTYQLWTISPTGTATSAGTFAPNNRGQVLLRASGDLAHTSKIGISVEPAGGSRQPTPGAIVGLLPL